MSIKTHTACRNKNKIKVKFPTAVSLCAYAATRMGIYCYSLKYLSNLAVNLVPFFAIEISHSIL